MELDGLDKARLPRHVAIIMDGNGRWAKLRGKSRIEGHRRGKTSVRVIVEMSRKLGHVLVAVTLLIGAVCPGAGLAQTEISRVGVLTILPAAAHKEFYKPFYRALQERGWIDGKSVVGMDVDEAVRTIRGKAGTAVRLTIRTTPTARPREVTIVRQAVEMEVVTWRMLEGGVGYVSLDQFNEVADQKVETALRDLDRQGMKALVLDLRGNPGGLLDTAIHISSRIIPPRTAEPAIGPVRGGGPHPTPPRQACFTRSP